jgi:hypothetical protein
MAMKVGTGNVEKLYYGSTLLTNLKLGTVTVSANPSPSTKGQAVGLLLLITKAS